MRYSCKYNCTSISLRKIERKSEKERKRKRERERERERRGATDTPEEGGRRRQEEYSLCSQNKKK